MPLRDPEGAHQRGSETLSRWKDLDEGIRPEDRASVVEVICTSPGRMLEGGLASSNEAPQGHPVFPIALDKDSSPTGACPGPCRGRGRQGTRPMATPSAMGNNTPWG
ncbi:MAG: hypothetical protein CM15mP79_1000 [Methanobacteriota archaeon]|nr:MAG: hypothetical protein CM15mP79_1000 [Euryarchaeota archaeon]